VLAVSTLPSRSPRPADRVEVWDRGAAPYPAALEDLPDPPGQIYAIGDATVLDRQAVAVVGARKAASFSLTFTRRLGRTLAAAGACVVSGLAIGVDAAAHEGALEVDGGRTCAVLGGGFDIGAPEQNRALRDAIAERGLLLSEWAPDVEPEPWMFPHRNRIIAALARATVLVQASSRGGALHTIRTADTLNRAIAVVPGPVDTEAFRGSNKWLHADGASLIVEPEDALSLLTTRKEVTAPPPELSADESRIWDVLAQGVVDMDTIVIQSHLPITKCLAAITALELAGRVTCSLTGEVQRR
jgi:DNA processing protein